MKQLKKRILYLWPQFRGVENTYSKKIGVIQEAHTICGCIGFGGLNDLATYGL